MESPTNSTKYLTGVQVIHQLHCLNAIRKGVYQKFYGTPDKHALLHMDHCIDLLRIVLQCYSDLTPTLYTNHVDHGLLGKPRTHTCRNFKPILEWATERKYIITK
ncbi:hypothetical protein LX32DRAFT_606147 [Colletotrichum zoysiae]|uniref:Tat pathway signal sequence n=1 Tax=Colletotrichum zoysiae TaxID=1216348 RepID=A0AAD9H1J2_9PEZI|nr:hypothetical protein LX32DRAFT_606147 [Colletotrichum zoysiae]